MSIEAIIYRPKTKTKEATTIHRGLKVSILPRIDDAFVLAGTKRRVAKVGFYCDLPDGTKLCFDCSPEELVIAAAKIEAERRGKKYIPGMGLVNVLTTFEVRDGAPAQKAIRGGRRKCLR